MQPMTQGMVTAVQSPTQYTLQIEPGFPSLMHPVFAQSQKWVIVKDKASGARALAYVSVRASSVCTVACVSVRMRACVCTACAVRVPSCHCAESAAPTVVLQAVPTRHKLGTLNLIHVAAWQDLGGGKFNITLQYGTEAVSPKVCTSTHSVLAAYSTRIATVACAQCTVQKGPYSSKVPRPFTAPNMLHRDLYS